MPKFLTFCGRFSWIYNFSSQRPVNRLNHKRRHTSFRLTISPLAFLILRSLARKYQKRDLATTSFTAKMRMRYSFGVGLASLGR